MERPKGHGVGVNEPHLRDLLVNGLFFSFDIRSIPLFLNYGTRGMQRLRALSPLSSSSPALGSLRFLKVHIIFELAPSFLSPLSADLENCCCGEGGDENG